MRLSSIGLLAGILYASSALAQPPRPIFSLASRYDIRAHARTLLQEQFSAASNGHTVGYVNQAQNDACCGWANTTFDRVATPAPLAKLNARLALANVGMMPTSCTTDPALLTTGRYELAWFGVGLRSRTLRITVVAGTAPDNSCPPQVGIILAAVRDFLAETVGAQVFDVGRSIPGAP
jgi:hypothetical protein